MYRIKYIRGSKHYYLLRQIRKHGITAESGEVTTQHLRAGSMGIGASAGDVSETWSCQHLGRTLDPFKPQLEPFSLKTVREKVWFARIPTLRVCVVQPCRFVKSFLLNYKG